VAPTTLIVEPDGRGLVQHDWAGMALVDGGGHRRLDHEGNRSVPRTGPRTLHCRPEVRSEDPLRERECLKPGAEPWDLGEFRRNPSLCPAAPGARRSPEGRPGPSDEIDEAGALAPACRSLASVLVPKHFVHWIIRADGLLPDPSNRGDTSTSTCASFSIR
jgi:hypothetical protein